MSRTVHLCLRSLHTSSRIYKRGPLSIDGWYPRDHMPEDYPKNEKERRAAAIRYGMRLEDYNFQRAAMPHFFWSLFLATGIDLSFGQLAAAAVIIQPIKGSHSTTISYHATLKIKRTQLLQSHIQQPTGMQIDAWPYDKDDYTRYAGNYPDYGCVTYDHKDPNEDWSDPHYRRNWNEGLNIEAVMHTSDRDSYTSIDDEKTSVWTNTVLYCRHLIPVLIIFWISSYTWPKGRRWKNDIMLKQYPYDIKRAYPFTDPRIYPVTNYTFEPNED